jgi:hypothetical protein
MKALGKLLTLAALGLAVVHTPASAQTGPRGPNVMVFGEDADTDTIPRGNRNFNRIQRAITEQLIARGFKAYNEVANTADILPQGRVRRQLDEMIEIAKVSQSPIDVMVVFQIYASIRPTRLPDTFRPFVRVDGRIMRTRSGQELGNFEAGNDLELPVIPGTCVRGEPPRECLIEKFGDNARLIGTAVGNALATKLAAYLRADIDPGLLVPPPPGPPGPPPPPGPAVALGEAKPICDGMDGTPFVVRVRDFDGPELNRLEEALTSFACYEHHRIVSSQPGLTDYWYETRADQARLTRNLRFVLEYMNLPGTVSVTAGNVIVVEKHLTAPHGVVPFPPGTR